ncbi:hypothetical protein BH18THE2_BH18THE2_39220 [soil metagenome]
MKCGLAVRASSFSSIICLIAYDKIIADEISVSESMNSSISPVDFMYPS